MSANPYQGETLKQLLDIWTGKTPTLLYVSLRYGSETSVKQEYAVCRTTTWTFIYSSYRYSVSTLLHNGSLLLFHTFSPLHEAKIWFCFMQVESLIDELSQVHSRKTGGIFREMELEQNKIMSVFVVTIPVYFYSGCLLLRRKWLAYKGRIMRHLNSIAVYTFPCCWFVLGIILYSIVYRPSAQLMSFAMIERPPSKIKGHRLIHGTHHLESLFFTYLDIALSCWVAKNHVLSSNLSSHCLADRGEGRGMKRCWVILLSSVLPFSEPEVHYTVVVTTADMTKQFFNQKIPTGAFRLSRQQAFVETRYFNVAFKKNNFASLSTPLQRLDDHYKLSTP